ncbi:MAG: DUF4390 domain-containing protein [Gammaproteobacteria bacterium]|nr:DUF4390 domain-containing protein [Gammaproteobacteria bacterium]
MSCLGKRWGAVLHMLVLLGFSLSVFSGEFLVTSLSTNLKDDSYLMNAKIDYRFTDEVLEALENGVPITLEVHVQIRRKGAWVWERDLLDFRSRHQIRYHALASVYQVVDMQSGDRQNFATQMSALSALGNITALPLISKADLEPDRKYILAVRSRLDIESLPLPLRPMAYITPAWNLDSEWSSWRLQP